MFDFGSRCTEQWNLVLCSPATVLFVLHLVSSHSLFERDICLELLRRGIAFFTPLPLRKLADPTPDFMKPDVLPAGYQFTRHDYEAYLDYRMDLLNDIRVCQVALMRGGITWRLSLSHPNASDESVLHGPTKYVRERSMSIHFNDRSLQDDLLTEPELNQICGVYECLTGKGTISDMFNFCCIG